MGSKIRAIDAIEILDSRGNPTVAASVALEDGSVGTASVPSGASTGEFEAVELRDGDSRRYRGKGVSKAVEHVRTDISAALRGMNAFDQRAVDRKMIELDGTEAKSRLGANAILAVSLATAHAAAFSKKQGLYEYLATDLVKGSAGRTLPVPLVNVINGGAHAANSLDIQEFMIVPHGAPTFADAIRMSAEVFHTLGELLRNDGYDTGVGDEGGYAPRLESMELAFEFLLRAIERAGYRPARDISLALDVAASELVERGSDKIRYSFNRSDMGEFSASELIGVYEGWLNKFPIVSIEDGLGENDWKGWKELTDRLGSKTQIVGDDLFVTNTVRLKRGIDEKTANSILVKVNQIGSLSETLDSIAMATAAGYTSVISHRSGETCDATIADLAVAVESKQIKTGSMCRGERTEKYNRLLWIEHKLGQKAVYTNPFARR